MDWIEILLMIAGVLVAGGWAAARVFITRLKSLVKIVKEAMADGILDETEKNEIISTLVQVLESGFTIYSLITKRKQFKSFKELALNIQNKAAV